MLTGIGGASSCSQRQRPHVDQARRALGRDLVIFDHGEGERHLPVLSGDARHRLAERAQQLIVLAAPEGTDLIDNAVKSRGSVNSCWFTPTS